MGNWKAAAKEAYQNWKDKRRFNKAVAAFDESKRELELKKPLKNENYHRKYRAQYWTLLPGYQWNPLANRYPGNKGCFCGSGVKAKRCCIPHQPRILTVDLVLELKKHWPKLLTGHVTLPPAPRGKN